MLVFCLWLYDFFIWMCFESPRLLVERSISQYPFLELFFIFLRQKPCLILKKIDDGGGRGKHNRGGAGRGWDFGCDIGTGMGRNFPPQLGFGMGLGNAHIPWDENGIGSGCPISNPFRCQP